MMSILKIKHVEISKLNINHKSLSQQDQSLDCSPGLELSVVPADPSFHHPHYQRLS